MSTETTFVFKSTNAEDTIKFGERIGKLLKPDAVIELRSDVGGGKTTFTRGLAAGFGSIDPVASPSFTISRVYSHQSEKERELHHFDFYRLDDPGLMRAEIAEVIDDPLIVVVVEWADSVVDVLPEDRTVINILYTGGEDRTITVSGDLELIQGLKK